MADPLVVGVIGHSYIRRLKEFIVTNPEFKNICIDEKDITVHFRARGGLTIRTLANSPHLSQFPVTPWMCFLQIGGNDATSRPAECIAQDIVAFANYLHYGMGIAIVYIGQLLRRDPMKSPVNYNDEVVKINQQLELLASTCDAITFWKHRGFWTDLRHLGPDGVHLGVSRMGDSPAPMVKYLRSIKYAIRHAKGKSRPVTLS
jgi:hypothetical protein